MAKRQPFKHIYSKLRLSPRTKPRKLEDRVDAVAEDLRELRTTVRDLIEVIECELGRDLDHDAVVGRVSPKRPLPKTARLRPELPPPIPTRKPQPLPPNIP
jgi:hypothetical protein